MPWDYKVFTDYSLKWCVRVFDIRYSIFEYQVNRLAQPYHRRTWLLDRTQTKAEQIPRDGADRVSTSHASSSRSCPLWRQRTSWLSETETQQTNNSKLQTRTLIFCIRTADKWASIERRLSSEQWKSCLFCGDCLNEINSCRIECIFRSQWKGG